MIVNAQGQAQVGDVGLVSIPGFVGWLIKKMQSLNGAPKQFCRYEHSFVATDVSDPANILAFEANPGGADFFNVGSRYKASEILWIHVADLTEAQKAALRGEAVKLKGTPYSFLDYFALLAHRVHLNVPWVRGRVTLSNHAICSQIIDKMYRNLGVPLFEGRWPGYVIPADYRTEYGNKVYVP